MRLHIGIAGPIATEQVADFLTSDTAILPKGYTGAPLTGVLIGELLKQGYKVSAFTIDPSLYATSKVLKAIGPNFDFYICPARPRAWRFNKFRPGRVVDGFAYEREQLFNAINLANPDIIHAHWTYEFALAAIKTKIPHLITCHDAPAVILRFTRSPYRAIRYLMARQVFQTGQHFSAVSDYIATTVQSYTKIPIRVVPNPLADYVVSQGYARETTPVIKRMGMICNGWDNRKNPQPSLLAFADFHRKHPSSELHLFGAGFGQGEPAQQWCESQHISSGMVFHGAKPHKILIGELAKLDVLIHPSLEESFGVVIAEAMALGLPIVAGRYSGAVPWVVGADAQSAHSCAVLTDVSDSAAISAAIDEVFDPYYPERSASGVARARLMYAPSVVAEAYLLLYKEILCNSSDSVTQPL